MAEGNLSEVTKQAAVVISAAGLVSWCGNLVLERHQFEKNTWQLGVLLLKRNLWQQNWELGVVTLLLFADRLDTCRCQDPIRCAAKPLESSALRCVERSTAL